MANMYTSLMTRSNLYLSSLGNSSALVALPHVATEKNIEMCYNYKTPTFHHFYFSMQSPLNKTHC
jgi:hypothetical protein